MLNRWIFTKFFIETFPWNKNDQRPQSSISLDFGIFWWKTKYKKRNLLCNFRNRSERSEHASGKSESKFLSLRLWYFVFSNCEFLSRIPDKFELAAVTENSDSESCWKSKLRLSKWCLRNAMIQVILTQPFSYFPNFESLFKNRRNLRYRYLVRM